jgi:hypothetical protein
VVKETIQKYSKGLTGSDIQVYGSVAQGLQMGKYFTRIPGDIEVSVDNPSKFMDSFTEKATKAGLTLGKDYDIKGADGPSPKVYFKNEGGAWEKGVEVFSHNIKYSKAPTGYKVEEGITYGFNAKNPLKVDGTDLMTLQEQTARKLNGLAALKNGGIGIKYEGRIKDVGDLVEIGVGYKLAKNVGNIDDIITFAKAAEAKYGKNIKSPVAQFAAKYDRMPTLNEIQLLKSGRDINSFSRESENTQSNNAINRITTGFNSFMKSESGELAPNRNSESIKKVFDVSKLENKPLELENEPEEKYSIYSSRSDLGKMYDFIEESSNILGGSSNILGGSGRVIYSTPKNQYKDNTGNLNLSISSASIPN